MSPLPFETLTLETTKRRGCDPFFWKSSPMGLAIIKLRSALEKRLRGGGVPRHAAAFFAPCGAVAVFGKHRSVVATGRSLPHFNFTPVGAVGVCGAPPRL